MDMKAFEKQRAQVEAARAELEQAQPRKEEPVTGSVLGGALAQVSDGFDALREELAETRSRLGELESRVAALELTLRAHEPQGVPRG